ncbi:Ribonuclease H domain [Dillenia turbinata]|uniref:Ribonuclease H domain n=1 Tax=Dillenia turbinata TaxID=194707 RepID=A0AAN8ZLK0_9MAGN
MYTYILVVNYLIDIGLDLIMATYWLLIRWLGEWVQGFGANIGATNEEMAELGALREGLRMAVDKRLGEVAIEIASLTIVNAVNRDVGLNHP